MIGGCINESQVNLKYILEISISSPEVPKYDSSMVTENTLYTYVLPGLQQHSDLEITITPSLPILGLNGSAFSTSLQISKYTMVFT